MKSKQKLSERITLRLPYDLSVRLKASTPHKKTGDVVRLAIENFLNGAAAETAAEEPEPPAASVRRKPIWESRDALIASQFDARLRVVQSIHGGGDNTLAITWARLTDRMPLRGMAGIAETADGGLLVTRQLMARMPWLQNFAETLERELKLQLAIGKPWFWMPPTILVGPPGVGKSHAARLIGQLSGCAVATLDLGGTSDNRSLEGTARGWSSAQPCWPLVTIHNTRCPNPLLVLDEVDKAAGSDANGRSTQTLLGMTEPVSAKAYFDRCLMTEADISQCSWILTANELAPIPRPLKSRLEVISVRSPTSAEVGVVIDGMIGDVLRQMELGGVASELSLPPSMRRAISTEFEARGSVRLLQRRVKLALGLVIADRLRGGLA
ncbi:MAG: AAA family ATPase [Sphingomonadaceae bacterium]|nr:AAA family ATPase [Sphingomonadaceae bacterium]